MDISTLRRGDGVELLVDANAIPAGCYQFREVQGEMSLFTVGKEVVIGLATDFWTKFMRPAKQTGARLSTEKEFLSSYSRLCKQLQSQQGSLEPSGMTFCLITPKALRKGGPALRHALRPRAPTELFN